MKHNCWTWALQKWLKHPETTYLVIRKSRNTIWPHVLFTGDISCLDVEEWKPDHPKTGWRAFFHAFRYDGYVRIAKGEEKQ